MSNRPQEQEAVCTTIVGGRPPGCGTKVGNIPRGIEILVKKAAVDPKFRERLLADRTEAANDIELELDPAEAMMLQAIPEKQLEMIIDQTTVPEQQKPAFLGKVAAAMLLALGLSFNATAGEPMSLGIRPEDERRSKSAEATVDLDKRKAELKKEIADLKQLKLQMGKLLDTEGEKKLKAELEKVIDGRLDKLGRELNKVNWMLAPTRGVRPDRPVRMSKGSRPDRPPEKPTIEPESKVKK